MPDPLVLLTIGQRLQHLEARLKELALWRVREHARLTEWSFDGIPLPQGALWPTLEGVRTLTHPLCRLPDGWPRQLHDPGEYQPARAPCP